jgi:hypothetical protein
MTAQEASQENMNIIKNEKLIKRNSRIGQWTTIAALAILGGGLYISISNPSNPQLMIYSLLALGVGFILTQVGMYFGNRWGRSPRPDEKIDAGLKGLPGDFSIYHFKMPASHLLVGPAGVWVLIPYRQRGVVTYSKDRWRIGGGGLLQAYMSIFGQEGIGRPDLEAEAEIKAVQKFLGKTMPDTEIPDVQAALVFLHEDSEIQVENAPRPALKVEQLKTFMRQKAKERPISPIQLAAVKAALPE